VKETQVTGEPSRRAILEALLFVAEEPLPLSKLQEALTDADAAETEASVRDLAVQLEADGRGLMVQEVAGGFRLATRPEVHAWVQRLQQVRPARLSRAALETLAIIAYRQPMTRAEIEAIRGVAVDGVLRTLLERELVRMMGRKAEAGRPMLYGTSQQFLEHFGMRDLGDLPTLREINELIGIAQGGTGVDAPTQDTRLGAEPVRVHDAADAGAEGSVGGSEPPEDSGTVEPVATGKEPTEADAGIRGAAGTDPSAGQPPSHIAP
jgi:segregation and condensation protein B